MTVVGAYPLDFALKTRIPFADVIAGVDGVTSVELPWFGAPEVSAMLRHGRAVEPSWRYAITTIPWWMQHRDEGVGLAAASSAARGRAVEELQQIAALVRALEQEHGEPVVEAVHLHSAPAGGNRAALAESLDLVATEDWGGCALILEHVDAATPGHEPEKGFLPLDIELAAAREAGIAVGLNWGRSAIELRDADAVTGHVRAVRESGLLRSLVFSGVADRTSSYGKAWSDAHLPFSNDEPASLLTPDRIRSALEAAGDVPSVGVKIAYDGSGRPLHDVLTDAVAAVSSERLATHG